MKENHECLIFEPEDAERLKKVASILLQGSDRMRDQGNLLDYLIHQAVKVDEEELMAAHRQLEQSTGQGMF